MPNLILFDYFTDTEDALKHGAELLSREFQDLKPSLIFPLDVPQPSVSTSHPAAVARAYSEDMLGAVGLCMHVIVLNTDNAFTPFELQLTMPVGRSLPAAGLNATLPFEGSLGSRLVPMSGSGKLQDTLAPNSVNVYRLGCSVPCTGSTGGIGWGAGCSALQKKNLSPNPDFEMAQLLGGVYGWAGGKAGWYGYDGHDLRARMFLDTGRPKHGRYSLRLTVPTSAPLLQPWAQACIDSYYPSVHKEAECNAGSDGTMLPAHTRYTIRLWARSSPAGMTLDILTGQWHLSATASAAYHTFGKYVLNETAGSASRLNESWQLVTGTLPAVGYDRFLQLRMGGGPGSMFIDDTFIGANLTAAEEAELRQWNLAAAPPATQAPERTMVLTPHAEAVVARNHTLLGTCLPCCDEPPPGKPCCCPGGCIGGCPGCTKPPSCPPPPPPPR